VEWWVRRGGAGLWASPVVVLSRRWSVLDAAEAGAGAVEVVKGAGRRGVAGRRIRYARDPIREEAVSWPAVSTKS
jgi:hypothetical protein